MNVSLARSYTSKNGNKTFVYNIKGTKAELAEYQTACGEFYREDENGVPLWFTTKCIGKTGKLLITTNGKIVPDMSEFDEAASLAAQYGGNFGAELAKAAAQRLSGKRISSSDDDTDAGLPA